MLSPRQQHYLAIEFRIRELLAACDLLDEGRRLEQEAIIFLPEARPVGGEWTEFQQEVRAARLALDAIAKVEV